MKFRLLPLLFLVIAFWASSCSIVATYFLTIKPDSGEGCIISIEMIGGLDSEYQVNRIFIASPVETDGLSVFELFDFGPTGDSDAQNNETIQTLGSFYARQFTYVAGDWFIEILGDVERNVVRPATFNERRESDTITISDNGWIWVKSQFVEDFEPPIVECDNSDDSTNLDLPEENAPLTRLYLCRIDVTEPDVPGRIGPGFNRSIRGYITQNPLGYGVNGSYFDEDGEEWYELDVPGIGLLWVQASQTAPYDTLYDLEPSPDNIYLNDCSSINIPDKSPPPILQATSGNSGGAATCENLSLIAPLGAVATGDVNFQWTPVDAADQYLITFYNFQGAFAEQYSSSTNSIVLNTGDIPTGSELAWEVYAMSAGEIICRTDRSSPLTRTAQQVVIVETEEPEVKKKKDKNDGYVIPGS